ncbi:MAG: acyl-CoA thioesterase [Desulfuromonadales bacterium]|nr:acyl-CoA thioesterase [Desulfuromonadales bacterium]
MKSTELTMTVLMTPEMANFSGNVHGGTILKFLDEAAYACASRYSASYVVTVSVGLVEFREPIHVGELVSFVARIDTAGHSSMVVSVDVSAENIRTRQRRQTNNCYFTMVAMEDGKPKAIPPYLPETADEKRRDRAAKIRREFRGEYLAKLAALEKTSDAG